MRTIWLVSGCVIVIVVTMVSTSRSDGDPTPSTTVDDTTEPITGTAVMPFKGSETPMRDPFTPYDVGDPASVWKYEDLTADEKAVADRGLDEDQSKIQGAYAAASHAVAEKARADAAAIQLGLDTPLDQTGVVP